MKIESVKRMQKTEQSCRVYIQTRVDGRPLMDLCVLEVTRLQNSTEPQRYLQEVALLEDYFHGVISPEEYFKRRGKNEIQQLEQGVGVSCWLLSGF